MKNWIVFDVMGIIFEVGDDTNDLLVPYIQRLQAGVSRKRIQNLYLQASLGQISPAEFWRQVGLGDAYPQVEQTYLDTCLTLDPQFKPTAEILARSYSIALLSNDVQAWSEYLRRRYGLEHLVEAAVISSGAGCRKPSPEIYQILLTRLNVAAQQCIFIDDRASNLHAAAKAGMRPVWFRRESGSEGPWTGPTIQSFAALPALVDSIFAP